METGKIEIRKVELKDIINLRHFVLRPHQAISDCIYESDSEISTFHVGAFSDGKLISIASFNEEYLVDFKCQNQFRLRAMATLPEYRRMGAGRKIVEYAESILKEKGVELLWCKGRTNVKEYYRQIGFNEYGDVFDYPPIGLHIVMIKKMLST